MQAQRAGREADAGDHERRHLNSAGPAERERARRLLMRIESSTQRGLQQGGNDKERPGGRAREQQVTWARPHAPGSSAISETRYVAFRSRAVPHPARASGVRMAGGKPR